jgi:hypothetical protein
VARRIQALSFRSWANFLTPIARKEMSNLIPNYYTLSANEAYDIVRGKFLQQERGLPPEKAEHLMLAIGVAYHAGKEAAELKQQERYPNQLSPDPVYQIGGRDVQQPREKEEPEGAAGEEI